MRDFRVEDAWARCPDCHHATPLRLPWSLVVWAALALRCPRCAQEWYETRTPGMVSRIWSPAGRPPGRAAGPPE